MRLRRQIISDSSPLHLVSLPCVYLLLASLSVEAFSGLMVRQSSHASQRFGRMVTHSTMQKVAGRSSLTSDLVERKTLEKDRRKEEVFFPFFPPASSSGRLDDMDMSQMIAMNVVGASLTVGIVYALASSNLNAVLIGASSSEDLGMIGENIVDAALPLSASDFVTVSFSEAVAAVFAAAVSLSYSSILRLARKQPDREQASVKDIEKAVGNGDFLLAQATATPLLESLGIPPLVATTTSVLLASVPAEVVRIANRKSRDKKAREDRLFDYLLKNEQEKKLQNRLFSFWSPGEDKVEFSVLTENDFLDKPAVGMEKENIIVDIASDLITWLGYSVLCADFKGQLTYNGLPLFPGLESATFGIVAALSAQVYADILYAYFGFGGKEKQDEIRSRTLLSWASTYFSEAAYSGIFFGFYEFAQIPAKASVSAFLSGGADACYGSQEFDLCLQAFESQNPPGASAEAELRSLVTTLVSLWNRYTPDSFSLT